MNLEKVYLLDYVYEFEDGHNEVKLLGVFSSEAEAKQALSNLMKNPKLKEISNLFTISENKIDRLGWIEGFITVD